MEKAILVTVDLRSAKGWTAKERSRELAELALSARAKVVREEIVKRHELAANYYIGEGKAEEIRLHCLEEGIDVVIFNNDLTGTQQKNLEGIIGAKVIDRTQLILDIFASRAHSNEGKIQVELAQLMYLLPRLTGKGVALSRLGGGIGTRGPGEQKLEVDRRRIKTRIAKLKSELETLSSRRAMMRKHRTRFASLAVAIVGYTNVGKSTLLNALTSSTVATQDKLFSTLDSTVRKFVLPLRQKALFIDTVGFLNDLPHHLIEAFKATLEEVEEADLILHIIDISHPKAKEQAEAVYRTLEDLGVRDKPVISVLNKTDKVEDKGDIDKAMREFGNPLAISALKRDGLEGLINRIEGYVEKFLEDMRARIPLSESRLLNFIYENGLITRKDYKEDGIYIEARVPRRVKEIVEEKIKNIKKT